MSFRGRFCGLQSTVSKHWKTNGLYSLEIRSISKTVRRGRSECASTWHIGKTTGWPPKSTPRPNYQ